MPLAYISHPDCLLHETGEAHPERPARLRAINDHLSATGLYAQLQHHDAPEITQEQLSTAHQRDYVTSVYEAAPDDGLVWLDPDTAMGPNSLQAARRAAGAAVLGVDLVMSGQVTRAFCAVRPPGHHAEHDRAMGFCLFNNVVLAAYHALSQYGLERVAIVDFDVHHCNGTENIVAGDERILMCSTFQHPFYPNSGADCRAENVVNVPLPAGTDSAGFRQVVADHWLGRLRGFAPQLILVSAGFDAHRADSIAQLQLVEDDYAWVTARLVEQANTSADGRIVSSLEGGYELNALAASVEVHLKSMM